MTTEQQTTQRAWPGSGVGPGKFEAAKSLKLLYGNVQSLWSKIGELELMSSEIKPDIIILTKTWLNQSINNASICLQGYEIIPNLRNDRGETAGGVGGGLLVYVRAGLQIVPEKNPSKFYQYSCFSIMTKGAKHHYFNILTPKYWNGQP